MNRKGAHCLYGFQAPVGHPVNDTGQKKLNQKEQNKNPFAPGEVADAISDFSIGFLKDSLYKILTCGK